MQLIEWVSFILHIWVALNLRNPLHNKSWGCYSQTQWHPVRKIIIKRLKLIQRYFFKLVCLARLLFIEKSMLCNQKLVKDEAVDAINIKKILRYQSLSTLFFLNYHSIGHKGCNLSELSYCRSTSSWTHLIGVGIFGTMPTRLSTFT
jgi:hypothetical protein